MLARLHCRRICWVEGRWQVRLVQLSLPGRGFEELHVRMQGRAGVGAGRSRIAQASLTARLQLLLRRRIGPVHGASASGPDDIGSRGAPGRAAGWQDCCGSCMWEWLGWWHGGRGAPLLDQLGRGLPVHLSCAQGRRDSNVYMTRVRGRH
jgi:hypothetical protein